MPPKLDLSPFGLPAPEETGGDKETIPADETAKCEQEFDHESDARSESDKSCGFWCPITDSDKEISSNGWVDDRDLCSICWKHSLKGLFLQNLYWDWGYRAPTKSLAHIKKASLSCKFCNLALVALGLENIRDVCEGDKQIEVRSNVPWNSGSLRLADGDYDNTVYGDYEEAAHAGPGRRKGKIFFYLRPKSDRRLATQKDDEAFTRSGHNIQLYLPGSNIQKEHSSSWRPSNLQVFSAQHMDNIISLERLKMWIRLSDSIGLKSTDDKTIQRFQRRALSTPIRAVDVLDGKLVSLGAGEDYVALSYVWGGAEQLLLTSENETQLRSPGGMARFQSKLPRTIAEAMGLCRNLELRYLWVDALCIRQDNEEDKLEQIRQMDAVYGNAFLTVVQASADPNTDANSPLAGLSPGSRRVQQEEAVIQGNRVILTLRPPFSTAIEQSKWYTRGWTLQEFYISQRSLIFTDKQVFLVSDKGYFFCEDTVFEHGKENVVAYCKSFNQDLAFDWDFNPLGKSILPTAAERFCYLLCEYTGRQLSDPGDALAAFSAVLAVFAEKLGASRFGIPGKIFDYCLCWSPTSLTLLERRSQFPSWSWAGWQGAIGFLYDCHPRRCRSALSTDMRNPRFNGSTVVHDRTSDNNQDLVEGQIAPRAASEAEIDLYYRQLLGHRRHTGAVVQDGFFLHFTASFYRLQIGNTAYDAPQQHKSRKGRKRTDYGYLESRDTGTLYSLAPPTSTERGDFPTRISVQKEWRQERPETELEVDFLAIKTEVDWRLEPGPWCSPGDENEPAPSLFLNLVPVRWEMARACEHCDVQHMVARRIGQIAVVSIELDTNDGLDEWIVTRAGEKFIVFG